MAKRRSTAHPGFKAVEAEIAQQPGIRNPGAVLAARTRAASPAAKRKNPRLKRVRPAKGRSKSKGDGGNIGYMFKK